MSPADLDALLSQTLADRKLSGSEKDALRGFAVAHIDSPQDQAVARSRAFEIARQTTADDDAKRLLTWLEEVLKSLAPPTAATGASEPSTAYFSPGDACLGQIAHRFAAARKSVDVCVFTVTDDRIARALLDAHRRGVAVRLITDNDKAADLGSDIDRIAAAGVPVRVDRTPFHMHHKFAIFDRARLLNGSYNWTRGAAEQNEENIVDTGDPRLVTEFQREFDALWARLA
jgi:phosphatidylserine/phosphatidylglycerophosphate/cardiolipin synthase-like enzyme